MEVLVVPAAAASYAGTKPELAVKSVALCRGLFEIFLGLEPAIPAGRQVWAAGAKNLLDSGKCNGAASGPS